MFEMGSNLRVEEVHMCQHWALGSLLAFAGKDLEQQSCKMVTLLAVGW